MIVIREATESDAPFLSRICLLTADAGKSSEEQHDFGEFPGLVFAIPYVKIPKSWGFVLEDELTGEVVGYVLGSTDTRYFEQYARDHWWGPLVEKYSKEDIAETIQRDWDKYYVRLFRNMIPTPEACVEFSPAHLHISILEEYQRKGWGRKLIEKAIEHLKEEAIDAVWLGFVPINEDGRMFFDRLGFKKIDGTPVFDYYGLRF